jgi:iron complex outermembrane recepter protein
VLLDGRRITPANGNGVVDVNVIPAALVESVEVITGGASAVYGSDAIAGVVNFKLKDEFHGVQLDGGWGQTEQGDGTEYNLSVTGGLGFAAGRGEAYAHVSYANRDSVLQGDRRFSRVALGYNELTGEFLPLGSLTILEGRMPLPPAQRPGLAAWNALFASYGYAPGTVPLVGNGIGFNADGTLFAAGNRSPGSVANFRGEQDPALANDRLYSYNFAPDNYLQLPLERITAFARGQFELTEAQELYAEILYADYSADTQLAPTPAMPLRLPASNPYIPADLKRLLDSRANPAADFFIGKRVSELGPRIAENERELLQGTLGLRGDLLAGWTYEAYLQAGSYEATQTQTGNLLRSRLSELTYAADGGVAACGGLDLFGLGSISPECARYVAYDGINRDGFDQFVAEVSASGSAFKLPAGDVQIATGILYKRDEYFYAGDPIAAVFLDDSFPDIQGFNAADDIEGSDYNLDLYLETLLPLAAEDSSIGRLDAVIGYRRTHYDSAGGVDAYKAELLHQPVQPLRLRASYQRAVRAPSVFELYLPQLPVSYPDALNPSIGLVDPCSAGSPQRKGPDAVRVEALCLAQGVPAELLAEFFDGDSFHTGVGGGNPDLEPETADTLTLGFALQSVAEHPWFRGMRLSLDWYWIEQEQAIADLTAPDYVEWCFDGAVNREFSPSQTFCRYFSRDPVNGEIVNLQDLKRNLGTVEVSGIDLQADWRVYVGPGEARLNLLASWMERFELRNSGGAPRTDAVGYVGGLFEGSSYPEWKLNLNLGYLWRDLDTNLQWRYVDGMRSRDFPDAPRIDGYDVFDLYARYEVGSGSLTGLVLRLGIENLTDEDPPIFAGSVQANTDPSQYDVLGRRYFASLSYRF